VAGYNRLLLCASVDASLPYFPRGVYHRSFDFRQVTRTMTTDSSDKILDADATSDGSAQLVLDDASNDAWQAYNAMFETKQNHYEFLEILENKKKKFNISPSEKDKQQLAEFLSQHDEQVKKFTRLSMELKSSSPESHTLLFQFIAQLGDGEPNKKTQH